MDRNQTTNDVGALKHITFINGFYSLYCSNSAGDGAGVSVTAGAETGAETCNGAGTAAATGADAGAGDAGSTVSPR